MRKECGHTVNLYNIIYCLPVGTRVFLKHDCKNVAREVIGYEWFYDTGNVLFRDGSKLSMNRLDLIAALDQTVSRVNTFC